MIVCGWHTPDYAHWAARLIASLDDRGLRYDIVAVPAMEGNWESKTLAKPIHILAAMDRHPDETIVFLDVDCIVTGDLGAALCDFDADVGVYWYAHMRRKGANPPYRFRVSSATMIFAPTKSARAFVEAWDRANFKMRFGDVDQTSFVIAMSDPSHDATFKNIGTRLCHTDRSNDLDPIIKHSLASQNHRQVSNVERRLFAIMGMLT